MINESWDAKVALFARLQDVNRFSVRRTHQTQSVAAHSFNVCWIYLWLSRMLGRTARRDEIIAILHHDLDEALTGDIPAPAKNEGARVYDGWDESRLLLKLADKLDQWLFVRRENRLGNVLIHDIERTTRGIIEQLIEAWNRQSPLPGEMPHDLHYQLENLAFADVEAEVGQYRRPS